MASSQVINRRRNAPKDEPLDNEDERHETSDENSDNSDDDKIEPKYGPMPKISSHRMWSRGVLLLGVLLYVWYTSDAIKETSLAKQKDITSKRGQSLECDANYLSEIKDFPECVPKKCGRYVSDKIVTINEVETLLNMAKRGISLAGSSGGASILDLHSGALSKGENFVDLHTLPEAKTVITQTDLTIYKVVKTKIQHSIAETFGINADNLYLTYPTFFSRLSNSPAKTVHDEYWHTHVDKETYESFHYTSLLYLTDFGVDFKGGRFIFVGTDTDSPRNVTVEPRKGRVLMFTSGAENPHFVEQVTDGVRYAITVSFTCDKTKAIKDPTVR